MGIFVCLDCKKDDDDDEDDKKDENKEDENKNINNNISISIKDLTPSMDTSTALYNKFFEKNPMDDYKIIKVISNSKSQISRKEDEEEKLYIMEKIDEYRKDINNIINEILHLDHQYITKIYYIYHYLNNYYIISEIIENNLLKEPKVDIEMKYRKEIIERLLKTINYLHDQNIYNIGLNFDTLFLQKMELKAKKKILRKKKQSSDEIDPEKKLVTYYFSLSVTEFLKLNYDISLIQFYSPEVINQLYIKKIIQKEVKDKKDKNDEWNCGIILYYLITGELPFRGKDLDEIYTSLEKTVLNFSSPKFNNSSDSEKDLLSKLLEKDENKRISISESLLHPFITEQFIQLDSKEIEGIDINLLKNLFLIQKPASKFHEVIIAYLSYHFITEEEKNKINYLFNYIDTDKDNKITEEDLIKVFDKKEIKYTPEQIKYILYVFDYDLNNYIQLQEFSRHICNKNELFKEENLKKIFNVIDINKNNFIDQQDILDFILHDESTNNFTIEKEFMENFGMNIDDKITYEEFSEAIRNNKILEKKNCDNIINKNKIEE